MAKKIGEEFPRNWKGPPEEISPRADPGKTIVTCEMCGWSDRLSKAIKIELKPSAKANRRGWRYDCPICGHWIAIVIMGVWKMKMTDEHNIKNETFYEPEYPEEEDIREKMGEEFGELCALIGKLMAGVQEFQKKFGVRLDLKISLDIPNIWGEEKGYEKTSKHSKSN